ncbi:MAG: HAD family hydrolase [Bacilli bacterium]
MKFKNLIFDIDGTLLDSYKVYMPALRDAMKKESDYDMTDRLMGIFFRMKEMEFYDTIEVDPNSKSGKNIKKMYYDYLDTHQMKCFDGVKETLNQLNERGFRLFINTSRTMENLLQIEDLKDILPLFEDIVTVDQIVNKKPHAESMQLLLDRNNLDPKETLVVADGINDGLAGMKAKIEFVLANYGCRNRDIAYHYIIEDIKEIFNVLYAEKN